MSEFTIRVLIYIILYESFSFPFHWKSNTVDGKCRIYCDSDLLRDVQLARIFPDSKTFVDKKLKCTECQIITNYVVLKQKFNCQVPPDDVLRKFVDEHFEDGNELEKWCPRDFAPCPKILNDIRDPNYRQWANGLNAVWRTLARKVKEDVRINPNMYSQLYVPNGFIIPGGGYKEFYYWDTYWIVNGLLLCEMTETARGIIDNFAFMVREFGFVPNGGRIYHLTRSQPPMLILMAFSFYRATNDLCYIKHIMPSLETEFQFWMENRMVTFQKDGKSYTMARYYAPSKGPRPESYREDHELAEQYCHEEEKDDFYVRLKSAIESGWDFSSRWFINNSCCNRGTLTDVHTPCIVPVDLNSILQGNAQILSSWFSQLGNEMKSNHYCRISTQFLNNMQEVMWRKDKGAWFDWDMMNRKHRENFFVSNIVPLWTGSYRMPEQTVSTAVLNYLRNERIIEPDYSIRFKGTPTSMYNSTQQWDYPYAMPCLQAFIIQGLDRTRQKCAQQVAARLAGVWLSTNYKAYVNKSIMFRKYNILDDGETCDINPQPGFGWTNGVVFELLNRWGESVSSNEPCEN